MTSFQSRQICTVHWLSKSFLSSKSRSYAVSSIYQRIMKCLPSVNHISWKEFRVMFVFCYHFFCRKGSIIIGFYLNFTILSNATALGPESVDLQGQILNSTHFCIDNQTVSDCMFNFTFVNIWSRGVESDTDRTVSHLMTTTSQGGLSTGLRNITSTQNNSGEDTSLTSGTSIDVTGDCNPTIKAITSTTATSTSSTTSSSITSGSGWTSPTTTPDWSNITWTFLTTPTTKPVPRPTKTVATGPHWPIGEHFITTSPENDSEASSDDWGENFHRRSATRHVGARRKPKKKQRASIFKRVSHPPKQKVHCDKSKKHCRSHELSLNVAKINIGHSRKKIKRKHA